MFIVSELVKNFWLIIMFIGAKIFSYTLNDCDKAHIVTLICCLRAVVKLLGTFAK